MIEKIIEKIIKMFPASMQEKVSAVFAISFLLIFLLILMFLMFPAVLLYSVLWMIEKCEEYLHYNGKYDKSCYVFVFGGSAVFLATIIGIDQKLFEVYYISGKHFFMYPHVIEAILMGSSILLIAHFKNSEKAQSNIAKENPDT